MNLSTVSNLSIVSNLSNVSIEEAFSRICVNEAFRRVRADYLEMPGLKLTGMQAQRLWDMDHATCDVVLNALVGDSFLVRTRDGAYMRSDRM